MSEKYEGVQAYVKNKVNSAVYIPCSAHSLNLVGVHSVDCCLDAINFFGFLQNLFIIYYQLNKIKINKQLSNKKNI